MGSRKVLHLEVIEYASITEKNSMFMHIAVQKSGFQNSANTNNSGQNSLSIKDGNKSIANTVHDTVDNANFNVKNAAPTNTSLSSAINCDDSNKSNNSSDKGSSSSVDGKHLRNHLTIGNRVGSCGSNTCISTTSTRKEKDTNNDKNSKPDSNHHQSALNTITQRLSHFSFGNSGSNCSNNSDKSEKSAKSSTSKRNIISFSGKTNNNSNILCNSSNNNHFQTNALNNSSHVNNNVDQSISTSSSSSGNGGGGISNTITSIMTSSLTKSKRIDGAVPSCGGNSIVSSYDPMKLIGTPACPRYDDCPVLEPLVCKKIAHERLTALIFREDCFLTACQDGFVYTWARPGFLNLPQHLPSSPTAPPGGTVV
ncbi:WD repeat-containing protein 20 homolog [Wyeomyia smithii]|uniref:WD repeat-containing protein 20 homolog n=1 Tax=Wyeomyia smithii TaxID=174621 RepID=UPI002467C155|nr:WD repeat-containing protein 20 homolog [Wyeomyia smithii]